MGWEKLRRDLRDAGVVRRPKSAEVSDVEGLLMQYTALDES